MLYRGFGVSSGCRHRWWDGLAQTPVLALGKTHVASRVRQSLVTQSWMVKDAIY